MIGLCYAVDILLVVAAEVNCYAASYLYLDVVELERLGGVEVHAGGIARFGVESNLDAVEIGDILAVRLDDNLDGSCLLYPSAAAD
ncbi:MAG: hypothetical protein K2F91_07835, partial [Muribaculaceae bacterium]|nr:hypothetical protein [Muribaculaceae bacterium]